MQRRDVPAWGRIAGSRFSPCNLLRLWSQDLRAKLRPLLDPSGLPVRHELGMLLCYPAHLNYAGHNESETGPHHRLFRNAPTPAP